MALLQALGLSRRLPLHCGPPPRQAAGDAEPGTFLDGSAFAAYLWEKARNPVLDFWP